MCQKFLESCNQASFSQSALSGEDPYSHRVRLANWWWCDCSYNNSLLSSYLSCREQTYNVTEFIDALDYISGKFWWDLKIELYFLSESKLD